MTPELPFDRPPDQAARHRIRTDLDTNLFVEAGAGAGKTTAWSGASSSWSSPGIDIGVDRRDHVHREGGRRPPRTVVRRRR